MMRFLLALLLLGCSEPMALPEPEPPPQRLDMGAFLEEFDTNPVRAMASYKGQRVILDQGLVLAIREKYSPFGDLGEYVIVLGALHRDSFVACSTKSAQFASSVSIGDAVGVSGRVSEEFDVGLDPCTLVEPPSQ